MPDGLVTEYIRVEGIDSEADSPELATARLLRDRRIAADEVCLTKVDEALEAGFEGTVDRPELPVPGWEVLLQAQRSQRPHTNVHQIAILACRANPLV